MKKYILIVLLFIGNTHIFAQYGYKYQEKYIELNVDTSTYFIQTGVDKSTTILRMLN